MRSVFRYGYVPVGQRLGLCIRSFETAPQSKNRSALTPPLSQKCDAWRHYISEECSVREVTMITKRLNTERDQLRGQKDRA
jgi:hypothetical protein